jgi:hypothetical protein
LEKGDIMKRVLIVALLATAMLIAMAAPALATDGISYRLNVYAYYDADGDGCWDACEPALPNLMVRLGWEELGVPGPGIRVTTNACGSAYAYFPAGTVVGGLFVGPVPWDYEKFPDGAMATEITPYFYDGRYEYAKVVMNGRRCMLFGVAPVSTK